MAIPAAAAVCPLAQKRAACVITLSAIQPSAHRTHRAHERGEPFGALGIGKVCDDWADGLYFDDHSGPKEVVAWHAFDALNASGHGHYRNGFGRLLP